ncbi:MAG: hypothetical protein ACK5AL_16115 [Planctomycetota bacterium]
MPMLAALLSSVLLSPLAQDPGSAPAPAAPAPTRIEWQRSLADALAVQQATGLPLLVVVNMDGEVFNERFAKSTYKDPAFVASTRGYVCVVASPDRHTDKDYDADGNRIECPRFGGCTCSEHINIEPELFRRYFNGTRNAPRHVGVTTQGAIVFDRFLDQSMQTAIDAIAKNAGDASKQPGPSTDPAVLFGRRDALARRTLEAMWQRGDAAARRKLMDAAADATSEPLDLMRAGLRDADAEVAAKAALALAKRGGKDALIDLEDALARQPSGPVHDALVARVVELAKTDEAAKRLAAHLVAPAVPTRIAAPWSNTWSAPRYDDGDRRAVEKELDRCEAALKQKPDDDETRLALSIAQVALADLLVRDGDSGPEFWFADAMASARKVKAADLQPEAQAVIAYAAYMTGEAQACGTALALAQSAVQSVRQPPPALAARFLDVAIAGTATKVFGETGSNAARAWRAEIDRVVAMLDLMSERKIAREGALLAGAGLLEFGGLRAQARARLADAVARFPGSAKAHDRWRTRLLVDLGVAGMRKAYDEFVAKAANKPEAEWFAGYAAVVAGEQDTRDKRVAQGLSAYGEAIERLQRSGAGNADFADSANGLAVLALAGRAELLAEDGKPEDAAADLLRAWALRPDSFDEADGLQRKPRGVASRVAQALEKAGKAELAAKLKPMLP